MHCIQRHSVLHFLIYPAGWQHSDTLPCRYQEKFYFNPGDTGFQVFNTKYAKIGVAICWDQWFPEAARCMALKGAEVMSPCVAIHRLHQIACLDGSTLDILCSAQ